MTLAQFLSTLTSNKVVASITEADGTLVSEIKAITHSSLDDTLEAREVASWTIVSNTLVSIVLKATTP